MFSLRRVLCCFLLCSPLVYAANSASPSKEIAKELKGQDVLLRGMEARDELAFDAQGAEVGQYQRGSFASSAIKIEKVHQSKTKLEIKSWRGILTFDPASHSRSLDAIHFVTLSQPVRISIAVDPSNPGALEAALRKIFAFSVQDDLAGDTSDEVKAKLATVVSPELTNKALPSPTPPPVFKEGAYTVGTGIKPPQLISAATPGYPREERNRHVQGLCVVKMIVNTKGQPVQIRIARSAGFDFDTAAIAAASQYRFKPATYQGKPVAVWINVEVNFRLY